MRRLLVLIGLTALMVGAGDPRPEWVDSHLNGDYEEVLSGIDALQTADPDQARQWGLDYLRGHLLDRLQRLDESSAAFARAEASTPLLADHSRFRLALARYRAGQHREAADLLATVVADGSSSSPLRPVAVRWLTLAILEGGDCELLIQRRDWDLKSSQVRQLQAAVVDCAMAAGESQEAPALMQSILRQSHTDEPARRAALALDSMPPATLDIQTSLLIGLTFFHHREFAQATPFLVAGLADAKAATAGLRGIDRADILYSLARSHYWQGQYDLAAQTFTQAAMEETEPDKTARSLFQRGRSEALQGEWDTAIASFREAAAADPTDSWAAAALLSAMRLEWRQGREESALELFRRIRSRRSWRLTVERGALFLAVSDLVRGRSDRADAWLDIARQAHRRDDPEIWYWRGRLAELQEHPDLAVRHYLDLMASDPLHPLALAADLRLNQPELERAAGTLAEQLAGSSRTNDLVRAWLLVDGQDPRSARLQEKLDTRWRRSTRSRTYLDMEPTEVKDWRIWKDRARQPEEVLLTLGIAETMSPAIRTRFPLSDTSLALAGSELLIANGLYQRSLYSAEVVSRRLPSGLLHRSLPSSYRRLLYPRPYEFQVEQQASRFGIDPDLLTAIMREESRFDPMAVSGASARGLTQFVGPTARRMAQKLGWPPLDPADLHQPQVAITLGAAYLAELMDRFQGNTHQVVAAYNAGEDLARLWQAYCYSPEPEEFFSKVGFRQTRGYLEKVLTSRAQYAEIYSAGEGL